MSHNLGKVNLHGIFTKSCNVFYNVHKKGPPYFNLIATSLELKLFKIPQVI